MSNVYSVPLSELVEEFHLEKLYESSDYHKIHVTVDDVSRPGLYLAGFFDHFEPMRLYVCGTVESAYLEKLSSEERRIIFDHFMSYKIPALIIARGIQALPECLEMAEKHNVTVLSCKDTTSYIVSSLITYLKRNLAPRVTRHGVLVEIYGEGILIMGDSGIGIINVAKLFGMGAVKDSCKIDLVIKMVPWRDGEAYDRLGMETQYMEILDVKVPSITIPITPGRNLAVIFEVAAMNNRQKRMGYNAALEFTEQMNQFFAGKENN